MIEETTEDIKNPQNQMEVKVQPSRLSGIHAGQVCLEDIRVHIKLPVKLDIVRKPCNLRGTKPKQKDCFEFKAVLVFIESPREVSSRKSLSKIIN